MNKTTVNYGIISTASIVPRFVNGIRESGNGNVIALSSRSIDKARALSQQLNIPEYYDDYHILLNDERIDCIYVPLVNSLHYPFAKEALLHGKNVVMEKPFVLHKEEGIELKQLARERNLFITEAVKTPFLPVFKDVKRIIESKEYGNVHMMLFRQSYVGSNYTKGWNTLKACGGGALYGNEAYFLTMTEYLCGRITDYRGLASYRDSDSESQCTVSVLTENNVLAISTVSSEVLLNNGLFIYLDNARIEIPDYWKGKKAYLYQGNELIQEYNYPCKYEMQYEIRHFNEFMLNGLLESPVIPLDDSIRHIEICEDLYSEWTKK